MFRSELPIKIDSYNKKKLYDFFQNSWNMSKWLYDSIDHRYLYQAPDTRRHPLIFYIGHSAVFYINMLLKLKLIDHGINEDFEKMFAKGVDPKTSDQLQSDIQWPSYAEVENYLHQAHQIITKIINQIDMTATNSQAIWGLLMSIDHERIHFETSSVLIRQYDIQALIKPPNWNYAKTSNIPYKSKMVDIAGGNTIFGKTSDNPYFGWDNEYGYSETYVQDFQVSDSLVSNYDYLEFVKDGGYHNSKLWSPDSQKWLESTKNKHPHFWLKYDGDYKYRAMYDIIDLPLNWPVEVNWFEASAYCRWKGHGTRLMREDEFERLGQYCGVDNELLFTNKFNLNCKYGSPQDVNISCTNGIYDIYGNVFQWLSNDFHPLNGFKAHGLYPDFSSLYFDSAHAMLRGGSWASSGASMLKYYRLWFRKDFFQHAGFRIVQS